VNETGEVNKIILIKQSKSAILRTAVPRVGNGRTLREDVLKAVQDAYLQIFFCDYKAVGEYVYAYRKHYALNQ
jgi:hypothetical protein